ncbi:monooxygenase FAD-binding protein [Aspergillus oryzae]|uniref:Monooxygenase FAD-binding protein n=2 Tax=Aspergillus oryzae TaxID=5062 RepID=A0A1S9DWD8_ASPOZ|nr:monooxygenase FAD-binding protein [Aspergillus oryzae]
MVSNEGPGAAPSQRPLMMPTYPSNCLQFAKTLDGTLPTLPNPTSGPPALNILVVGAGLGGLVTAIALTQAGHKVTIYEQTAVLGEVGAGIQIPSNSARILFKLGLESYLKPYVTTPESISFRRWQNGKVIGKTRLIPDFIDNFHAPYYVIHRADFHSALCQKAEDMGIEIRLGARVVDYDSVLGSITLHDGTRHTGDLVVAVDGIKSVARNIILDGKRMPFQKPGFAAYRAVVDVNRMRNDPEVSWILERPALNIWIGDSRHVMTYTIGAGRAFNMVLSHPDTSDPATWDAQTALQAMKTEFQGWDSVLTKIIGMVEKTIKWPLMSGSLLTRWTRGKLVILGDAAHAMLPYMSQGAAMAVEDGVALARSSSYMQSQEQLTEALTIFEKVRILRAGQMQEASLLNGQLWHFADGPLQEARDAAMAPEVEGLSFSHSPNQWSDPATQMWCYGYEAEREIDQAWAEREGSRKK